MDWTGLTKTAVYQGLVTYTPVEAFATGIKNLDWWKSSLITWSLCFEALDHLILQEFEGQNVVIPLRYLKCVDWLIFVSQNSSWSLDRLLKEGWSLDSILIPVTTLLATGDVYVTNPCIQTPRLQQLVSSSASSCFLACRGIISISVRQRSRASLVSKNELQLWSWMAEECSFCFLHFWSVVSVQKLLL